MPVRRKRLQNIVAESRFSLPVTVGYAVLGCFLCGMVQNEMWIQLVIYLVSSLFMVELNNSNALIRIYSRMVSCSYMALILMASFLLSSVDDCIVQLMFIAFYSFFFKAYQDSHAVGKVFYAFLMLGIASTVFIQVLFFVPVMWILLFTNITAGNLKTIISSVIGLMLPYWFLGSYYFYTGQQDLLAAHFASIASFGPLFDFHNIGIHRLVTSAAIAVLSLIGIVHFHRNSYKGKIRTRLLFEIFMTVDILAVIFMILQPQHFDFLLGIVIVNTSPLIAHYIALTRTWLTNVSFYLFIVCILAITVYNIYG